MGKGSENKLDEDGASTEDSAPILSSSAAALNNAAAGGNKTTYYDWDEVRKHNKPNDMWIVVNDNVYDVTQFKKTHPGGHRILEFFAGQDATVGSVPQQKKMF
jgi:cytochrome b involved in lipid metabolism